MNNQHTSFGYKNLYLKKYTKNKIVHKKGIIFLTPEQEKNMLIAPPDLSLIKNSLQPLKRNQNFTTDLLEKSKLIGSSTNQIMSIGTGLIPFIEHDDANRSLMGSNMQRQALPLKYKEAPLLETGIETKITKSSQMIKIAKKSGLIVFTSNKKLVIEEIEEHFKFKNNISLIKKYKNIISSKVKNCKYERNTYKLEESRKSNQNTRLYQIPIIKNKEWVKKGQIITDGIGTISGKLSLGKSILISYMSWEGYNFEDAIVISKRLINNDIFTSTHTKRQKIFFSISEKGEVRIRN